MLQLLSGLRHQDLSLAAIRIGVLAYVTVMFVPHTGAVRTLALYLPVLMLLWRYLAGGRSRWEVFRQPVLLLFMLWVLVHAPSVLYAPDLGYSLDEFHGSLLRALILALLVYEGFRDEVWLRRLFQWLGWLALGLLLVFGYHVVGVLFVDGMKSVTRYGDFRGFGEALVLLLPMAYWNARNGEDWRGPLFWLVVAGLVGLAFLTGARGVLAGALIAFVLLIALDRNKTALWILLISLVLGALAFWVFFHPGVVDSRLSGLSDSSGRVYGIWLPSIKIWLQEAPWLGFGYGPSNFDPYYREAVSRDPALGDRVNFLGLHNQWLLIAVQTGLFGIIASLLLWASQLWIQLKTALQAHRAGEFGGVVLLAALIGHYGVRGLTDIVSWVPLGLLVGMAAALGYLYRDEAGRERPG